MSLTSSKTKYDCRIEWTSRSTSRGKEVLIHVTNLDDPNHIKEQPIQLKAFVNTHNITTRFHVGSSLDLNYIVRNGSNVDYYDKAYVSMELRDPKITASIFATGRVITFGAKSEEDAKVASRRVARIIQNLNHPRVKFLEYRVTGFNGGIDLPFTLKHIEFAKNNKKAFYEPELNVGDSVEYKIEYPIKARFSIFSSGKITYHCANGTDLHEAISHIISILYQYRNQSKKFPKETTINASASIKKPANEYADRKVSKEIMPYDFEDAIKLVKECENSKRSARQAICYNELDTTNESLITDDATDKGIQRNNNEMNEEETVPEYALLRERNIEERQKLFQNLNIEEDKNTLKGNRFNRK